MRGIDAEFTDLPGFIHGITARIWEGREVGAIRRWYADDIILRSPTGIVVGNGPVVTATLSTLSEFPDRRLPGEDVIWTGDEAAGFLSSHRLACWMTHEGSGAYGEASGRRVRYRIIADCVVRENQIREEWLARDQGAIAQGLGMSPRALAERQIAAGDAGFFSPERDRAGAYRPLVEREGPAAQHAGVWSRILGTHELSAVRTCYDRAVSLCGPGGEVHVGHAGVEGFFLGYLAALPGAQFTVEHAFAQRVRGRPTRVAMRFSLDGVHAGHGRFGPPSGARVHVMGFTHAELAGGRVEREWVVTDEVAIWKQVLAARRGP